MERGHGQENEGLNLYVPKVTWDRMEENPEVTLRGSLPVGYYARLLAAHLTRDIGIKGHRGDGELGVYKQGRDSTCKSSRIYELLTR